MFAATRINRLKLCLNIVLCLAAPAVWADSQREVFDNFAKALPADSGVDKPRAAFTNPEAAAKFFQEAFPNAASEYCIIHVLRWAEPKPDTPNKQDIQAQNWYLFRRDTKGWSQEDFTARRHLAGVKQVYVAFIHLNIKHHQYDPRYVIDIARKTPSNIAHLLSLVSAFAGQAKPEEAGAALANEPDRWGGGLIKLKYVPSTIKVTASEQSGNLALETALSDSSFDNEGPMYWDVGIAVPIRTISQVQINTSSGVATPVKVSEQSVFATFNGYLPGLDPSRNIFRKIPHPLAGVAFAQQPLHKILVGGGWGPSFSELFMGALWVKQPVGSGGCGSLPAAGTASPASRFCAQFAVGVNLQISSVLSAIRFH